MLSPTDIGSEGIAHIRCNAAKENVMDKTNRPDGDLSADERRRIRMGFATMDDNYLFVHEESIPFNVRLPKGFASCKVFVPDLNTVVMEKGVRDMLRGGSEGFLGGPEEMEHYWFNQHDLPSEIMDEVKIGKIKTLIFLRVLCRSVTPGMEEVTLIPCMIWNEDKKYWVLGTCPFDRRISEGEAYVLRITE
ncbi:MAG: hypothetical protein WCF94_01675 [bacterium]